MTRALLLLMTAAATCQGGTQSATFHSGGDLILVTNADKINFNGTSGTAPVRQASATGSPVQVVWVERGMTMHARSLDATWVEIDPVTTEFRRAQMQGDAMLVIDGAAAEKALAADAEANHKPVPPAWPPSKHLRHSIAWRARAKRLPKFRSRPSSDAALHRKSGS